MTHTRYPDCGPVAKQSSGLAMCRECGRVRPMTVWDEYSKVVLRETRWEPEDRRDVCPFCGALDSREDLNIRQACDIEDKGQSDETL